MKEFFEHRRLTGNISLTLSSKRKWSGRKEDICNQISSIVQRYQSEGYRLTLRQLYYQLVAADAIPNDDVMYKKLSGILDDMRYSGKIDWAAIEDRGRVPYLPYFANSTSDAMEDLIGQYRLDRMHGQDIALEIWTEKDAISGILKTVTREFHVRLIVNKGYSSSSAMHGSYERFAEYLKQGKKVKILYFGDHDPSGLDMVRDIEERILFFLAYGNQLDTDYFFDNFIQPWWQENGYSIDELLDQGYLPAWYLYNEHGDYNREHTAAQIKMFLHENGLFEVVPIGLTMAQIQAFNPPPNPAKITDPRAAWYIKQFGPTSWEVDALPPNIMTSIVRDHLQQHINMDKFNSMLEVEKAHISKMRSFAKTF